MPEKPLICRFSVKLNGELNTVTVSVHLDVPTFVRFEMNVPSGVCPSMVVAVWSDGQWNVFEGDQSADPRHLLAITLTFGTMTFGPRGSDWLLVRDLLINLTQSAVVHYR
ncbi:hypothetical protein [Azospirillum sp. TSO35-2]|jgi:hypothetical protein|uniref:hypothetical protein n=1 Tax=Azospirillum sp. TSO35-2 TaxID=716796 RepID=UPI0011B54C01|nr:hypothetical protein [Azospirillum sp. TSO35-2]